MDEVLYDAGWMKLYKTGRGFIYSERRGVRSTALLLYRLIPEGQIRQYEILTHYQPLPVGPVAQGDAYPCPITGSLLEGDSPHDNIMQEALEEGGFDLNFEGAKVVHHGNYFVGTQTNEVVLMFSCDVTGIEQQEPEGDGSYWETVSHNQWHPLEFGLSLQQAYSGLSLLCYRLRDYLDV